MKTSPGRCKCLNCNEHFLPDYRNRRHQRFCSKPGCRKARKRASQKAWRDKPENQNYFRDAHNAARVRTWQKEHPGYWKNSTRWQSRTLQDDCSDQVPAAQELETNLPSRTLQDLCSRQTPLLVGLISMLTGSTLQEDIATTTRRLLIRGQDILSMVPGMNVESS